MSVVRHKTAASIGLTMLLAMFVSACTGGSTTSTDASDASPTASPTPLPGDVVEGYFTGMVNEAPAQMLKESQPGSSAAAFAAYWRNGLNADNLAERALVSTSDTDAVVKRTDNGKTTTYKNFQFNPTTGLLESWSELPGGPLRIVNTKKSGKVTPLRFSVRQQYIQNKDVVIAIVATNKNRQPISLSGDTYVAPNGRSASVAGVGKVPPRSRATLLLTGERAGQVGGRLTLYTYPGDGGVKIAEVTVKLPAK